MVEADQIHTSNAKLPEEKFPTYEVQDDCNRTSIYSFKITAGVKELTCICLLIMLLI